jgi:hypothetical protein
VVIDGGRIGAVVARTSSGVTTRELATAKRVLAGIISPSEGSGVNSIWMLERTG